MLLPVTIINEFRRSSSLLQLIKPNKVTYEETIVFLRNAVQ